ncbi:MAG: SUMF1/EgtB/PvdO family nonheme iron enzyme, partial [Acidobacteria bacterium]|nr:SUMF1/EgtB/PvdO family nonheme iron enzyme [Acidobacteriota bacterium]
ARNRSRSRSLFDLIDPAAYYTRPIALRNPIVFYEGHLPAFSIISFLNRGLGRPGVDPRLEELFARGIDPESVDSADPRSGASTPWPRREDVLAFGDAADALVIDAIKYAAFDESRPAMRHGEALFTALEHEAMHQETLLYMWRRLPYEQKVRPTYVRYETRAAVPGRATANVPAGTATLGVNRGDITFGWDNEFNAHTEAVAAFEVDVHSVTNEDYLPFVEAGHAEPPAFWLRKDAAWFWRGMFEPIPLPPSWPVYVSHEDASAFANWRGRRLMTEAEYHRAAQGVDPRGGHADFAGWEPVPAGSRPAGVSAWGVHDLAGNGWEWTSSVFAPLPGFEPMVSYPEYSAEFFDGQHYVMKGASSATAKELIRPSFRNWFRPNYPYVTAKFRTAVDA